MKNLLFLKLVALFFVVTLLGCTDRGINEKFAGTEEESNSLFGESYLNALSLVKNFDENSPDYNQTRALEDFIVLNTKKSIIELDESSIQRINMKKSSAISTKNNKVELFTFEFQKDGSKGFSIVSGDARVPFVFAYTENGQFSDTLYNHGLRYTLNLIPVFCKEILVDYYLNEGAETKAEIYVKNINAGPFIKTTWGQGSPYNNQCPPGKDGGGCDHSLAGCTAIALAQAIAYRNAPLSRINGYDYKLLTAQPQISSSDPSSLINMVSSFVNYIGIAVKMDYNCGNEKGSGAHMDPILSYLKNWKYLSPEITTNSQPDELRIVEDIASGRPVLTTGFNSEVGHTWIWDGARCDARVREDGRSLIYLELTSPLTLHCNWGWSGTADGWYLTYNQAPGQEPYQLSRKYLYMGNVSNSRP